MVELKNNSSIFQEEQLFATIVIPHALPMNYTWIVPTHLKQKAIVGIRVEVPLRNKKYAGIIKQITNTKPNFEAKEIINILDDEPLLYSQQLQLWQWMANYYLCSEGEVMQAAVPANLKLNSESILIWNDDFNLDDNQIAELSDEEFIVAQALEIKKELRLSEVQQLLDVAHVYPVIKKLIQENICFIWEELKQKYKAKTELFISLHPTYFDEEKLSKLLSDFKAPKQMELLLAYLHLSKTEGEVIQTALLKKSNASATQLKALVDKKILIQEKKETDRVKFIPKNNNLTFTLSAAQQNALNKIKNCFHKKNVCLLHGVTASGKTQIYIALIEAYIKSGKQVLYMLPEIALTSQIIRKLQQHFGADIAIYHSKFNPNERVEIWNKVKNGTVKAVLGARSAVFLPFKNLALIIIDEEHDASYKQQDPAPRYHARDTAIYYASLLNAKVLLGSATPSVESYYNATQNKYGLVELKERYGDVNMPAIEIIDLKKIPNLNKEKIAFSPQLLQEISIALHQKKQVILFQNRRGYSPYSICKTCGWIPHCKQCDVTLTFHKAKNKLSCHYCGTSYPAIQSCVACGSHHFIQKNFGTEQIEEILSEKFSDAKIARMDIDSVKGKNDHDTLIKLFEQQRIDILVGTQMVVKGLDFEHVQLVGIIDADGILNFTDFKVNERAFQLMEQVSGRAGRKDGNGKVLIQVSNTHHPVLQFVQQHNFNNLFWYELESRKTYHYPPFSRIIQLTCKHKENFIAQQAATTIMHGLNSQFANYLTGPAQPVIDRIRNQYLWEIMIKLPKDTKLIHQCKQNILQHLGWLHTQPSFKSVSVSIDVDPN